MRLSTTVFLIFIFFNVIASEEKELKTAVKEVTVFLQGAQVTRTGETSIPAGKSVLLIKSLSPYLDAKSIIVKATGNFTVLSVNHKFNHINQLKSDLELEKLTTVIKALQDQVQNKQIRLSILTEKQSILTANKLHVNDDANLDLVELKNKIEFYDKELTSIKAEEMALEAQIKKLNIDILKYEHEITNLSDQTDQPSGEIEIAVESKATTKASFKVSYLTDNAGWYPGYDIRVKDVAHPILLNYKAEVYQNTGVDWDNVKLKFSNADPNQSGLVPELDTWYLNLARYTKIQDKIYGNSSATIRSVKGKVVEASNGEPLPGVNVLVKGTTLGTVTDFEGNYDLVLPNKADVLIYSFIGMVSKELPITRGIMNVDLYEDVKQLQEVVVTGYAKGLYDRAPRNYIPKKAAKKIVTTTIENQTTVEFEVKRPYSLQSGGKSISINLKEHNIEALYQYYAVPKVDKDAFLMASIVNWDQYNLLEGEANLYFEDAYVGRTVLEANSLADTLNISLGRDRGLVVGREKVEDFTKRKTIGGNIVETRGFRIIARNKKSQPVKLTIFDQIPTSAINSISVNPIELSKAKFDEKNGKVSWVLELAPNNQHELQLSYQVKYPKYEKVYLE